MSRKDTSPNARSLLLHLFKNYWSEGQSWGSYGETCLDVTFVAVEVISKCSSQSLATLRPLISGALNCHFLAALIDCSAKYLLLEGVSNSAVSTVPAAFT